MNTRPDLPILLLIILVFACGRPNTIDIAEFKSITSTERTIEVTGSAEMSIIPDQIELLIEIKEYYEEEFQDGKKWEDYKTKVKLVQIEKEILDNLSDIGIAKKQIKVQNVGNYWRFRGKELEISKEFSISLNSLEEVDMIISSVNMRGIDYMRIGKLEHKDIEEYRKQIKIKALFAAKEKAGYLLSSIDKKVGDIITIKEIENNGQHGYRRWLSSEELILSNNYINSEPNMEGSELRTIKLRYEIKATFEIE